MKKDKTSLSVLVPVYNEQYLVENSLKRLFVLNESPYLERVQIIVVDDASKDNTPIILKKLEKFFSPQLSEQLPQQSQPSIVFEWIFLRHEKNCGKGKAIQTALKRANCEITVIHDADLEYYPRDLLKMMPLFVNKHENADAVYGSRFASSEYRKVLYFKHHLGNVFLTFLCNLVSDLNLTDMETCYKMVRTDLLKSIPLLSNDFRIEPELTIKLAKRNAKIFEVPISYCGRTYQEGKKISWKDGVKALWVIFTTTFSDNIYNAETNAETEEKNRANVTYCSKNLSRLARAYRFNKWVSEKMRPYIGNNVLEIGAGIGNLTKNIVPRNTYFATDINLSHIRSLEKFSEDKPYMSIINLNLENPTDFLKLSQKVDTVLCANVLEHIEDDRMGLKNINNALNDNGRAILFVPRGKWLYGQYDKSLGHKKRYSKEELYSLAEKSNFTVEKIIPFNRLGPVAWYVNSKLLRRKTFGLLQIYALNFLTPILKRVDPLIPFLPSLNYIAILKKEKQQLI
ncbi:MAG: glycosyltransferase [Oligoflexia bacterium]|nr:glycosyltransferase [Oligoflexia bacterium]